jgi:hypothetical protein
MASGFYLYVPVSGAIQYQNYKVSLVFISYCCNTEPLSSIGKTESSLALKELAIQYQY